MGRLAKKGAIGAAIVGGVAALGLWANSMRKSSARASQDALHTGEMDALRAQQEQMMQQAALAAGPADGRAPNEWQTRVRPGSAPQVAVGPAMTAVPADQVQDLGAPGRA